MATDTDQPRSSRRSSDWIYDLLLLFILLAGAYLRFTGLHWDEGTYLHPDERFLAMVETSIEPTGSFSEYWDTQTSSLNPNNRDKDFFVYGTLPIFFVRYVMEWTSNTGYGQVADVGRPLAGVFDLLTIFVLYLAAARLYNRRVALLAAALSAFAVLQIQLSHFFTVDIFANFFIWLAIYFGVLILKRTPVRTRGIQILEEGSRGQQLRVLLSNAIRHPALPPAILFGVATGAAAASKASAFPIAFLLPLAVFMHLSNYPLRERNVQMVIGIGQLMLAGLLAALTFRIFQPYAFSGPGFFGITPSRTWLETIARLRDLVQPSSGFPPSVQWFDRPLWFSGQNLTLWGLGLPMGIAAWAGFIWMGYRIVRGSFRPHLLVWLWVGGHFLWQSMVPNPTMRYQLPIYPGMALMAAWFLSSLWERFNGAQRSFFWARAAAVLAAISVLAGTVIYAAGFSSIYGREVTRIEASRWIYRNIPGALNLHFRGGGEAPSQLVPFPTGQELRAGAPYQVDFIARSSADLVEVTTPHVVSLAGGDGNAALFLSLNDGPQGEIQIASSYIDIDTSVDGAGASRNLAFDFPEPVPLEAMHAYLLRIELVGDAGSVAICDPISFVLLSEEEVYEGSVPPPDDCRISSEQPYEASFTPESGGGLPAITISQPLDYQADPPEQTITLSVVDSTGSQQLAQGEAIVEGDTDGLVFSLDRTVPLVEGQAYRLRFNVSEGPALTLEGTRLAQESSWDDALPMRLDGYDGFGGIYKGDNNLELYWEDNAAKIERIIGVLDAADYIPISSSRQWGSLTRLADRWPLVDRYYRELLGCPEERTVEWCYNVTEPGMFEGRLGFELVQVFQSDPGLGAFHINDQPSEEAFTVYDHPKVLIFRKTADYDSARALASLVAVTLPGVGDAAAEPDQPVKSLLLDENRIAQQESAGTWAELFRRDGWINRFQPLTVLVWYVAVTTLGLAVFPLLRWALPGLADRGYPFARTSGLLLASYLVWLLGSAGLEVGRGLITLVIAGLLLAGFGAFYRQRVSIMREWREQRDYYLLMEVLALALFLFVLFIRTANPDLWHPWKGGEKPMDFAYFNAVLKSSQFPPYDPWFAGGYINYYYYGFVYVAVLVKWLGIVPSVAYNLAIPTLFMLVGLGAFSVAWNVVTAAGERARRSSLAGVHFVPSGERRSRGGTPIRGWAPRRLAYLSGLASTLGIAILGNFGTIRMIFQGYQRVAAPPEAVLEETLFLTRWVWALRGFFEVLSTSAEIPYALADWYWFPSRAIPAAGDVEPITEFPFFTFLYGDLHAHMLALPLTLLALAWALSVVFSKGRWRGAAAGAFGLLFGALVVGSLRPTNTWDYPTYLVFGILALVYVSWRYLREPLAARLAGIPTWLAGGAAALGSAAVYAALSLLLFQPYARFYSLGYTRANIWEGSQTPLSAYLTHWGLFLFVIVSWMLWETRGWLASTPAFSGLRYLREKREFILAGLVVLAAATGLLLYLEVEISVYVLPLAAWAAVLIFRPGASDAKRIILFLAGTGLTLTLVVETVVISGDIGRMNTVFKFYLQVWILFGVAASVCLSWLLPALERWAPAWSRAWRLALGVLVFLTALYPLLGGFARIEDRMAENAPLTLDGIAYMPYATYYDQGREIQLVEDYRAIRWLQDNIAGTPVIVEAQVVEYRWGSRFSINTGLPAVLGWNWHQRQQRTGHDLDVWDRAGRIEEFYTTTNVNIANRFLEEYRVRYIIVGQLERAYYEGAGLDKFETFNGRYWQEVYRDGQTVIYEVIPQ